MNFFTDEDTPPSPQEVALSQLKDIDRTLGRIDGTLKELKLRDSGLGRIEEELMSIGRGIWIITWIAVVGSLVGIIRALN
jgi:hypothetical protein